MENVILTRSDSYDIEALSLKVEEVFDKLNVFHTLKPKSKVLILPTLTGPNPPDSAKNTHPNLICAVVNVLTKNNIRCIVAGCPYGKYDVQTLEKTYLESGLINAENISKFSLSHGLKTIRFKIDNGVKTKSVDMLDVVNSVDAIVNIGKLILDPIFGYSGSTTNLLNLIPGELKTILINRLTTISDYNNFILDIYSVLKDKIKLNIVDAVVSLEQGVQRMLSCIGFSKNSLSLDAAMLDVLGIDFNDTIVKSGADRNFVDFRHPYKASDESPMEFRPDGYNVGDVRLDSSIKKFVKCNKLYFASHQERMVIDKDKCKGCMVCTKICPSGAITIKRDDANERYAHIDYSKCIFCNKCYTACPYGIVDVKTPVKYKTIRKDIEKYNIEE